MVTELTLIVLAISSALILLIIVLVAIGLRWDSARTVLGPIEELSVYEARIEGKRLEIDDIEKDLEERRKAIANVADRQAEVDALNAQRENLLIEWDNLREKREEVLSVREEMEEAITELHDIEGSLITKQEELNFVKDRLEKAENISNQIETLTKDRDELEDAIEGLRDQKIQLTEAEKRLKEISSRQDNAEKKILELEAKQTSKEEELANLESRLSETQKTAAQEQNSLTSISADVSAGRLELLKQENEARNLEAQLAHLRGEISKTQPGASAVLADDEDQLVELKEVPPVIKALVNLGEPEQLFERDALKRVAERMQLFGLDYPVEIIRAFHTSMKVNQSTQMTVLAGISGTGKSQLPRQYANALGIGFQQVPVQPRWDSPQDLMGFYNYIEGKFRPTDLARALYALDTINNPDDSVKDRMLMVLLDEMNLARVEYYFSDFLSKLESRPGDNQLSDVTLRKDAEIELEIPRMLAPPRIFPGYNLLFAGTMNEDESTQSLSDKVYDRANVIRFAAPKNIKFAKQPEAFDPGSALSRENWKSWIRPVSDVIGQSELETILDKLIDIMRDFNSPFGHRLGSSIMHYVANYPDVEGVDQTKDALSDQVEMRLLPKLRGIDVDTFDRQFNALIRLVEADLNNARLAEAITRSKDDANAGQFIWNGTVK